MMTLYSGITCPFSQRCRFVLYEKGMDFEIKDVDIFNKCLLFKKISLPTKPGRLNVKKAKPSGFAFYLSR